MIGDGAYPSGNRLIPAGTVLIRQEIGCPQRGQCLSVRKSADPSGDSAYPSGNRLSPAGTMLIRQEIDCPQRGRCLSARKSTVPAFLFVFFAYPDQISIFVKT